jgi:hypothetical protein
MYSLVFCRDKSREVSDLQPSSSGGPLGLTGEGGYTLVAVVSIPNARGGLTAP